MAQWASEITRITADLTVLFQPRGTEMEKRLAAMTVLESCKEVNSLRSLFSRFSNESTYEGKENGSYKKNRKVTSACFKLPVKAGFTLYLVANRPKARTSAESVKM